MSDRQNSNSEDQRPRIQLSFVVTFDLRQSGPLFQRLGFSLSNEGVESVMVPQSWLITWGALSQP